MGFFMQLRFVLCILLVVVCFKANAVVNLPPNVSIPAVFAFGDSIVDTGNNNNLFLNVYKSNFPPYGDDFPGRIATGRFSNGKVPSDILAGELGIKDLVPAYKDPNLNPNELPTGVSFASGGGGYDPTTSNVARVYSLSTQLDFFKEYIQKLRGLVGDDKTNFTLANSIFLVVASTNDISTTFFSVHPPFNTPIIKEEFSIYATLLVNSASDFLKEIYDLGARRIVVFGAPPIGCLPFQRTVHGLFRNCVEVINIASMDFNDKLSAEINSLKPSLTNSKIAYIDIYNPLMAIINGTDQDGGFNVVDRGCCGTGLIEASYLCNHLVYLCPNHTEYMFWDSFHPTEALYKYALPPSIQKYIDENLK